MRTLADIQKQLENQTARSAWGRGVLNFAIDLLGDAIENNGAEFTPSSRAELEGLLLNGAENWSNYSREERRAFCRELVEKMLEEYESAEATK